MDNDSDHMAAVEADDAAAGAAVSAVVPSAAAVGADAGATAVAGAGAAVGCSAAAVTTDALVYSSRDATQRYDQALLTACIGAGRLKNQTMMCSLATTLI